MSIDLKSKDGQNKFIDENMSSLLEGINNSYGPVLVEELMKRLSFTIDEFNEEITSAFKDLKVKEDNRQKMYHMIKEVGHIRYIDSSFEPFLVHREMKYDVGGKVFISLQR